MHDLLDLLRRYSFRFTDERKLQDGIEEMLRGNGVAFEREYILSAADRVDFFLDGVCLECKIDKSYQSVLRQLHRYAQHEQTKSLVLVTNRAKHLDMPESLNSKPVAVHFLILSAL